MLMPSARLVGVGMDYRHPVDHMRVGKQRDTAYIRKKQYRQKIFRYVGEQPFHDCRFYRWGQRYDIPAGSTIDKNTAVISPGRVYHNLFFAHCLREGDKCLSPLFQFADE